MLSRYIHQNVTWIDLESPTQEEIRTLMDEFGIDTLIADELLFPSTKPRVELTEHFMYLVLHFPAVRHTHKMREQEIDIILGKNFIITTRYEMIDPLHKFSKVFEVNSLLDKSNLGEHAGFVLYYMLKRLYRSVDHELDSVRQSLSSIEEHIFSGDEVAMVSAISESARALLNIRQTIEPHREVLREFETAAAHLFGPAYAPFARSASDEYYRVHNHVMRLTESVHELRETNNSLLSTKQNETMRVLTIMALFTFPLSLIATTFAIDAPSTPFIRDVNGFWIIVGLMIAVGLSMFAYFRYQKWL
jgi:magnesium transporter